MNVFLLGVVAGTAATIVASVATRMIFPKPIPPVISGETFWALSMKPEIGEPFHTMVCAPDFKQATDKAHRLGLLPNRTQVYGSSRIDIGLFTEKEIEDMAFVLNTRRTDAEMRQRGLIGQKR